MVEQRPKWVVEEPREENISVAVKVPGTSAAEKVYGAYKWLVNALINLVVLAAFGSIIWIVAVRTQTPTYSRIIEKLKAEGYTFDSQKIAEFPTACPDAAKMTLACYGLITLKEKNTVAADRNGEMVAQGVH